MGAVRVRHFVRHGAQKMVALPSRRLIEGEMAAPFCDSQECTGDGMMVPGILQEGHLLLGERSHFHVELGEAGVLHEAAGDPVQPFIGRGPPIGKEARCGLHEGHREERMRPSDPQQLGEGVDEPCLLLGRGQEFHGKCPPFDAGGGGRECDGQSLAPPPPIRYAAEVRPPTPTGPPPIIRVRM